MMMVAFGCSGDEYGHAFSYIVTGREVENGLFVQAPLVVIDYLRDGGLVAEVCLLHKTGVPTLHPVVLLRLDEKLQAVF